MNDLIKMKNRVGELAGLVRYHADLYHNQNNAEITDAEFDSLVDELTSLVDELEVIDSQANEIVLGRESLDQVGSVPTYGKKVTHTQIMGSLSKSTEYDDIRAWYNKYATPGSKIVVSPKIDGCAGELNYVGLLVGASTRGDGYVGMDITDNVKAIQGIPHRKGNQTFRLRGEFVMKRSEFKKLSETGERVFANPRNAGTGSLMAQDPQVTGKRNLSFMCYDILTSFNFEHESEKFTWMKLNMPEFEIVPIQLVDIDDFPAVAMEWEAKRPLLDYEIDGLVIALDNINDQAEAGWNGRRPRGKMAFKFPPVQAIANVLDIDLQVGRTGRLTPMARIQPTLLDGSTISNITLHNYARVKFLNVAIGDDVLIEKAGDIIPQVVRVKTKNNNDEHIFGNCPSCDSPISLDSKGINLWCTNIHCPAQLERSVLHWVKSLGVMGVGPGIIRELCGQGFVKQLSDLYYVTESQMIEVTGGKRAAEKAQNAILEKSEIPLAIFLDGLGIDGLGTTTSNEVAKKYKTLKGVLNASSVELVEMKDIGTLTAQKIIKGLCERLSDIEKLTEVVDVIDVVEKSGTLSGMSFVLTGAMSKSRKEIVTDIEKAGGEMKSSVGKGVTYLVQADPNSTSSKTQKAQKVGTKVISEEVLYTMIG